MNEWIFKIVKVEEGKETVLKRFTIIPKKGMKVKAEIDKIVQSSGLDGNEVTVILENIKVDCKPEKNRKNELQNPD